MARGVVVAWGGNSPWAYIVALGVFTPVFMAAGVFMAWRPADFVRRRRVFASPEKPVMPGEVAFTRGLGCVCIAFTAFWTVGVIVSIFP